MSCAVPIYSGEEGAPQCNANACSDDPAISESGPGLLQATLDWSHYTVSCMWRSLLCTHACSGTPAAGEFGRAGALATMSSVAVLHICISSLKLKLDSTTNNRCAALSNIRLWSTTWRTALSASPQIRRCPSRCQRLTMCGTASAPWLTTAPTQVCPQLIENFPQSEIHSSKLCRHISPGGRACRVSMSEPTTSHGSVSNADGGSLLTQRVLTTLTDLDYDYDDYCTTVQIGAGLSVYFASTYQG